MGASGTRLIGYPTRARFAGCTSRLACRIGRAACDSTTAHQARPRESGGAPCFFAPVSWRPTISARLWANRALWAGRVVMVDWQSPAGRPHGVLTRTHHGLNAIRPHRLLCFVVRLVAWPG